MIPKVISQKEAKEQGLKFYYNGKPCKNDHVAERYVSSAECVECRRNKNGSEQAKIYREVNKEKRKEYDAAYHLSDKENRNDRSRRHHHANKEKYNAASKLRYALNREVSNAKSKAWREANKGYISEYFVKYRLERPEIIQATISKRRAVKISASVSWANPDRIKDIYKECSVVNEVSEIKYQVDHIVPLNSRFVCGLHWEDNLQILPGKENIAKGNRYWPDMPDTSDPELIALADEFYSNLK